MFPDGDTSSATRRKTPLHAACPAPIMQCRPTHPVWKRHAFKLKAWSCWPVALMEWRGARADESIFVWSSAKRVAAARVEDAYKRGIRPQPTPKIGRMHHPGCGILRKLRGASI
ncbi:hypothetical protein [Achromobacter sp. AGC39]